MSCLFFFLLIRRPPRSTLFPYTTPLPICRAMESDIIIVNHHLFFADLSIKQATEYAPDADRKSTRLNSSHMSISYAVFCLKKKKTQIFPHITTHITTR